MLPACEKIGPGGHDRRGRLADNGTGYGSLYRFSLTGPGA
jgi:hypothetical protein